MQYRYSFKLIQYKIRATPVETIVINDCSVSYYLYHRFGMQLSVKREGQVNFQSCGLEICTSVSWLLKKLGLYLSISNFWSKMSNPAERLNYIQDSSSDTETDKETGGRGRHRIYKNRMSCGGSSKPKSCLVQRDGSNERHCHSFNSGRQNTNINQQNR